MHLPAPDALQPFQRVRHRHTAQLVGAHAAGAAVCNGVSAESQLLDPELLQLLRGVQAGEVSPEAATLQLRERTAGYEQARSCHNPEPQTVSTQAVNVGALRARAGVLLQWLSILRSSASAGNQGGGHGAAACALWDESTFREPRHLTNWR